MLTDCTAVDFFENKVRFEVMYSLLSITYNSRLFVKIFVNEMNSVFSVFTLYNCATWLEREIWDMFGIFFKGHPNLCRILTDYGFEGFPLRKDFPMSGYISVRYDDISSSVIYESIELSQDFRFFDFKKSI
jgi:NADH/F420H2 dehydrogenase subunit C